LIKTFVFYTYLEMGGGASSSRKEEDESPLRRQRSWGDVPVTFADLQTDGAVEHRLDEKSIRHRGSVSSDYGRISSEHQVFASQAALEAQAAAHWHRIISHAKDGRVDAISEMLGELSQKPRCPECARGNPAGPICRICGRDASKDVPPDEPDAAASAAPTSSSPSGNLVPRVGWNPTTKSYDRMLVDRLLDSESIASSHSGGSPVGSPLNRGSPDAYAKVDFTDEDTHMHHILNSLLNSEGLRRTKDKKSMVKKLVRKLEEGETARSESPASDAGAGAGGKQLPGSPLHALRKKKGQIRRKFMGLGLDSDSDNEGGGKSDDEGRDGKNKGPRSKRRDEEESEADLEEAGSPPEDPELPQLEIQLKSRNATSITLSWDVSEECMDVMSEVQAKYGNDKSPIYQVQYRLHLHTPGPDAAPSDIVQHELDKWIVGCKRTKDRGATIENLVSNTPYAFRCIRKGWGPWSQAVVIRSGPGAPSAPKLVVAKEVTSTSVLITWTAPEKDNGLPVVDYLVRMKPYQGSFEPVSKGRERCFQAVELKENWVHIFEVQAINKAGGGEFSERLAVRTLPAGSQPMTPWTEAVDEKSEKLYYCHPKTNAVAWSLPRGALIDESASFRSKRAYLRRCFEKRMQQICASGGVLNKTMTVAVSRGNLLEDSLRRLYGAEPEELDGGLLRVRFEGEEGLDAGGLAKDWFVETARKLYEGSAGLLRITDAGFVAIDPRAAALHKPTESKWLFKAVGQFLAKALIDNQTLGMSLERVLTKLLLGREPVLDDLRDSEPEFFKGLNWVLDNNVEGSDLTFTCSYELFGESKVVELVPFGAAKLVDDDNKGEYVGLMQTWLFNGRYQPALGHMLAGFSEHVPLAWLQHFRVEETQMLFSGSPSIDVSDVKKDFALQGGFTEDSPQVVWLWDVLEELDQELLSQFVSFFSGCPCLPYDGLDPPLLVTLSAEGTDAMLPRAHTCFNQLVIPAYTSKEVLRERLLYGLREVGGGFHMT